MHSVRQNHLTLLAVALIFFSSFFLKGFLQTVACYLFWPMIKKVERHTKPGAEFINICGVGVIEINCVVRNLLYGSKTRHSVLIVCFVVFVSVNLRCFLILILRSFVNWRLVTDTPPTHRLVVLIFCFKQLFVKFIDSGDSGFLE